MNRMAPISPSCCPGLNLSITLAFSFSCSGQGEMTNAGIHALPDPSPSDYYSAQRQGCGSAKSFKHCTSPLLTNLWIPGLQN